MIKPTELRPVRPTTETDIEKMLGDIIENEFDSICPPTPPDIGVLTSEAVLAQYEHAAKSIEAMGDAVKESVAELEAAMADHAATLKLIADAADHYREKGKEVQQQIKRATAMTANVRAICADLKKMGG